MQYFVMDVVKASPEEISKIAKQAEKKMGPIKILFNNAGFCQPGMFLEGNAIENA